jgi:hypothetical protein
MRIIMRILLYAGSDEFLAFSMKHSAIEFHGERRSDAGVIVSRYTSDAEVIDRTYRTYVGLPTSNQGEYKQMDLPFPKDVI